MARLQAEPFAVDFFQAVRRLECAHPDRPRVGTSRRLADDLVRFRQSPRLDFAPASIARVGQVGETPVLDVSFFGLVHANGPMPLPFVEEAYRRLHNEDDPATARFLDVFHDRMIGLFYRAWAMSRPTVHCDRPTTDGFAGWIASLLGLRAESMRDRDAVPDTAKLHYAGRLSATGRCAEGLGEILTDDLGVPVRVVEFVGRWIGLPDRYRCRLGESQATGVIGHTAMVGSRVWDCQQTFRLVAGPLDLESYERLLPTGVDHARLVDWVRTYAGEALRWDVQLVLRARDVPAVQLGRQGRLGWTTWLYSEDVTQDADDLILTPVVGT